MIRVTISWAEVVLILLLFLKYRLQVDHDKAANMMGYRNEKRHTGGGDNGDRRMQE